MKPARESLLRDDLRAAKFARETAPKIEPGDPEVIEEFLRNNGPYRRIALIFLARIWRDTVRNINEDRPFAVAMAAELLALEESRQNYQILAAAMESAYERLRAALLQRPDLELLLAEAERTLRDEENPQ